MEATLLTLGVLLVLVGLIGQVKAREIEVGTKNPFVRIILGVIGGVFVAVALRLPPFIIAPPTDTPTVTSAPPIPTTIAPSTDTPTATSAPPIPTTIAPPTDSPIPAAPTQQVISSEQAIRDYFSLIGQNRYESYVAAFDMLSEGFKSRTGVDTLDEYISGWIDSGPASIVEPLDIKENGNQATATITLHYSKKGVYHGFRYELFRNAGCNIPRFGCWQIVGGTILY